MYLRSISLMSGTFSADGLFAAAASVQFLGAVAVTPATRIYTLCLVLGRRNDVIGNVYRATRRRGFCCERAWGIYRKYHVLKGV